jgi:hypothetical protein
MTDQTPSLDDFRQSYETDNNAWWRLECGHHMNLFDAALEALDAARGAIDAMQTAHESQLTRMAKERARLQRKVDRLEAAQRPPLGYVAMARPVESDVYSMLPTRNLATDKLSAEMQRHRFEKDPDVHVIVAEVREVQP